MSDLQRLIKIGELLEQSAAKVKRLESELKQAKLEHGKLEREDLPQLMAELGMSEFVLASGTRIKIKEEVDAAITAANAQAAHRWLEENGFGGLIKTRLQMDFPRDEHSAESAAAAARELLQEAMPDVPVDVSKKVHPQTLKAFVREQMESGNAVPMDLFSVHPYTKATITKK